MPITLDFDKVRSIAKRGHTVCHGEGTVGRQAKTGLIVLCQCVLRGLRRRGIDLDDRKAVARALGPDPEKKTEAVPESAGE